MEIPAASSPVIAKETGLKLNLTKFDSEGLPISYEDLVNLHSHDIRSLDIALQHLFEVPEYIIETDEEDEDQIDIVRVLKTCLNENSLQNLRHLSCDFFECFPNNWSKSIGELLPNLVSFEPACIYDLTGIGHFKNVQILSLFRSPFNSTENLEDILKLPSLRVLILAYCDGFFETLLLCNGTFQNLKLIDCLKSDITETQLRILVRRHPSLETIALLETPCDHTDFSDLPITVFNLATFQSTMNTLHYALDKRAAYVFCSRLSESINRLAELLEIETIQGFKEDEFLKMMMQVADKCPRLGGEKDGVAKCLIPYFKRIFPDQSITEILQKLDSRDALFVERRWAAQTVLRFFPEP
uniref:F-box domain-containing protein n=1 Tax=Caenorhabditis tropicalis TaxID=1561998 RepID=A0A1I7TVM3_9PELO